MNILDYLATEFATFDEKPFNPLDSAVLSQFCMVRAELIAPGLHERETFSGNGTTVGNLVSLDQATSGFATFLRAELYSELFTGLVPGSVKDNLVALAASPRFRSMVVRDCLSLFDVEQQTQFAAMTFVQDDEFAYVGFRGTDSSIVGWKEDFNMACSVPVPAQEQAARYLEAVASRTPQRLIVGGHSKGGNLAEYAALKASPAVRERIERVYIHDGPGFKAGAFSAADYAPWEGRLHKTVPQDSVIGLIMESQAPLRAVKSTEKGINQHSIFSWQVEGDDFVYLDGITDNARATSDVMREWLGRFDDEALTSMVEAFFRAIEASGVQDAFDLIAGGPRTITLLSEAAKNTQGADKEALLAAARSLAEVTATHIGRTVSELLPKPKA